MLKTGFKQKLARQEQTYGCWVTLAHPLIPEILTPAGFDWLAVDMEHSSIDLGDLYPLLMAIESNGMTPLVRLGENDPNLSKRVMDAGAHGVIFANICKANEARLAVEAVKYPPTGTRGVGLYRANRYGKEFQSYLKWVEEESVVIVQIEHIKAVNNVDEIFQTKGIDAFIIGPYDISGSLGKPGQFEDPAVVEAIERVMSAARRHNLTAGFHSVSSDPVEAARRRAQGFRLLGFSLDSIFLGDAVSRALKQLKETPL